MNNYYQKEFLTPDDIADLLQVTSPTVINWVKSGRLKAIKVERVIRIPQESFQIFLKENAT